MNQRRRRSVRTVETLMTIERNDREFDVQVRGEYRPGTPDVRYLPNGDPGYPGDPPEVEDIKARVFEDRKPGEEVELTEEELERAHELLIDAVYDE